MTTEVKTLYGTVAGTVVSSNVFGPTEIKTASGTTYVRGIFGDFIRK